MKLHGLAAGLFEEFKRIPTVDCHEHLPPEADHLRAPKDITWLFSHYCTADLSGAGLPLGKGQKEVFDSTRPLMPRWRKLKPAFEAIRYGSYAYPALAYVRDVLGFEDIDDRTVEAISERLQADSKPGLYRRILVDLCNIERVLVDRDAMEGDQPGLFVYLCRDRVCGVPIARLEAETGRAIHSLADYVEALRAYVAGRKRQGAVGYKIPAAYSRCLDFPATSAGDAERIFVKLRA
jgi:hypothetical protein